MDKTPKYIKMSDWPEVQEGWKPAWGDFVVEDGVVFTLSTTRVDKSKLIHLKRQDQLQEKMPPGTHYILEIDGEIAILKIDVDHSGIYNVFQGESPEQCLIQGVMHELHGKVWDDKKEEWV